jgi:hypothetical protein
MGAMGGATGGALGLLTAGVGGGADGSFAALLVLNIWVNSPTAGLSAAGGGGGALGTRGETGGAAAGWSPLALLAIMNAWVNSPGASLGAGEGNALGAFTGAGGAFTAAGGGGALGGSGSPKPENSWANSSSPAPSRGEAIFLGGALGGFTGGAATSAWGLPVKG